MNSQNRLKILSIALILTALLLAPTNAIGQTETDAAEQVILTVGEKAPFTGVIVPEYMYREMLIDITTKDLFDRQLQDCKRDNAERVPKGNATMNFISGMGLGALISLLAIAALR